MKDKRWIRLVLTIPGSHQDLLVGQLTALGFEGFLQEDDSLEAYVKHPKWDRTLRNHLAYCLGRFEAEFPRLKLKYTANTITRKNWNQQWEQSIQLLEVTPRFIIKPSWKKLRRKDNGRIVLHIDPKMSFGTGHHETTRLCLLMLEEYSKPQMSVLDFGSGTGILAIAAVKLGAKRAVAVDNDEWTIPNIRENLKRNRVKPKVNVLLGGSDAIPKSTFDLIVANIDLPTITKVLTSLVRKMNKGGILILSGVLTSDLLGLYAMMAHKGLGLVNIIEENEWSALAMVKT